MLTQVKLVMAIIVMLAMLVDKSSCASSITISVTWVYRGRALVNNTVLTFNKDDTLNLACAASASPRQVLVFSITKGTAPPTKINMTTANYGFNMTYTNPQTLIYDDVNGVYDGFENIIVLSKNYIGYVLTFEFKVYMNIPLLRPVDGGKYFCSASALSYDGGTLSGLSPFASSGALTIQVNVKPGQAHSSRADARNLFTYSAVLLSASKLLL